MASGKRKMINIWEFDMRWLMIGGLCERETKEEKICLGPVWIGLFKLIY